MIQAAYIPEESYVELFPESADTNRIWGGQLQTKMKNYIVAFLGLPIFL